MFALTFLPKAAAAHVKWFCPFDVSESPQSLDWILDPKFIYLILIAATVFAAATVIENSVLGRAIVWSIDRVTTRIWYQTEVLMRVTYGAFFVSLWSVGGIIMTPELTTQVSAISWLQLFIGACFIWRQTLILAAAGMVFLYGYAIKHYGLFHLMDYPIFLGAAGYFTLTGLERTRWRVKPLDVVRCAASVTLMWASVEKWGYPQWTYPLFVTHPEMSMGFDVAFYMKSAGVVEFSLAFALIGTPLMRRTAAIILGSMFVAAVLEFGKIDAIGHSPIIVVMLAIAADNRPGRRHPVFLAPVCYLAALAVVIAAYYAGHAALFPAGGL
ncbi:MAG: hypothetical protein P4L90_05445 [Rhodopila sp.]|nr:hypothetical protein [Rhodopila sp.]